MRSAMLMMAVAGAAGAAVVGVGAAEGRGAAVVYVDFAGGWASELDNATGDAGVTDFDAIERGQIESNVLAQLQEVYAGYDISFTTIDPGGTRNVIDFGVSQATAGANVLGFAPLDVGNIFRQTTSVAPHNFAFFIDEFSGTTNRSTQIAQISRGLSGTAAHELGHSLGHQHHHAYASPGIGPANYANTGGLQNLHISATGPTGLSESGREQPRTFNRWERAILDIAGQTGLGGQPDALVSSPVASVGESIDAGNTPALASALSFTTGATSGMDLALRLGDLDGTTGDVDVYSFTTSAAMTLVAEVFSTNRWVAEFDPVLSLYDTDGSSLLFSSDDVFYSGDVYDGGSFHEFDPFLLNIPLADAGTYFLSVEAYGGPAKDGAPSADVGDDYWLLVGLAEVPEPSALVLGTMAAGVLLRRGRREP